MTKNPTPQLIRATVAARRMATTARTLISVSERGEMPGLVPVKIGKLTFFSAAAVDAFLAGATAQIGGAA